MIVKYLTSTVIETYEVEGDFRVEILWNEQETHWEAWLYHKGFHFKSFVLSVPKQQNCRSKEEFAEIINTYIDEFIAAYRERFMEE